MRCEKYQLYGGNYSNAFPIEHALKGYNHQKVFQHREFGEYYMSTLKEIVYTKRWEYVVYDDNDAVVASMIIYREFDLHVGDCLSVLLAFSQRPRELVGGYRWLFELAKEMGIPFVSYTREVKPCVYQLVYKEVK